MTVISDPLRFARQENSCQGCPIRERALCAHCTDSELDRLEVMKSYRTWRAGEVVMCEGDDPDFVASVVSGCATLTRTSEDGRAQMVGLLLPSDFVGRPGRATAPYEIAAASDLTLCMFRKAPFEKLTAEMPHLHTRLLEMALDELDAARDWMFLLARKTAREKVATFLLALLRRAPNASARRMEIPLSREAIASYLGLTIETVSRQITALRKEGLIELEGARGIFCPDLSRLAEVAGADEDGGLVA